MNIKRILLTGVLGLLALKAATLLYAAIDNPITEIKNTQELNQFLKAHKLVVIEFYSPTCPVCNAFKRKGIFKETALALPHIQFAMVSSEEAATLHHEFNIQVFPTFIFFRNGKKASFDLDGKHNDRYVGYVDNPHFTQKVSSIFSSTELQEAKKP